MLQLKSNLSSELGLLEPSDKILLNELKSALRNVRSTYSYRFDMQSVKHFGHLERSENDVYDGEDLHEIVSGVNFHIAACTSLSRVIKVFIADIDTLGHQEYIFRNNFSSRTRKFRRTLSICFVVCFSFGIMVSCHFLLSLQSLLFSFRFIFKPSNYSFFSHF